MTATSEIKAITLYQPWAWLVARGWKEVETRSWSTAYRGPLAIHAGKKHDEDGMILHLTLNSIRGCPANLIPPFEQIPFGCVVATCQLEAVLATSTVEYHAKQLKRWFEPKHGWEFERSFGNYGIGRWAWILRDVVPIDPPIPAHGWKNLWNWKPPTNVAASYGLIP